MILTVLIRSHWPSDRVSIQGSSRPGLSWPAHCVRDCEGCGGRLRVRGASKQVMTAAIANHNKWRTGEY